MYACMWTIFSRCQFPSFPTPLFLSLHLSALSVSLSLPLLFYFTSLSFSLYVHFFYLSFLLSLYLLFILSLVANLFFTHKDTHVALMFASFSVSLYTRLFGCSISLNSFLHYKKNRVMYGIQSNVNMPIEMFIPMHAFNRSQWYQAHLPVVAK